MLRKQADMVMTIDDLAAYLKLSKSTAYKLCQESKIPGQKVGRHWQFHKVVIDRWLDNQEHMSTDKCLEKIHSHKLT